MVQAVQAFDTANRAYQETNGRTIAQSYQRRYVSHGVKVDFTCFFLLLLREAVSHVRPARKYLLLVLYLVKKYPHLKSAGDDVNRLWKNIVEGRELPVALGHSQPFARDAPPT